MLTVEGTPTVLFSSFTRLRSSFRGALLRPGVEGYDDARRVWNGAIDRRPALIARPAGVDDVQLAVRYAQEQEIPLSVRGGGHSVTGYGVIDDGLVVDLSLLKTVAVDPVRKRARAAGGVLWSELDLATQRHGLATTGGSISSTGVAGVTLTGGFGHLLRKHGLGVDNVTAVDLVTADGSRRSVDDDTEPELIWGLRGGGGNFGIAASLEFAVHPVGPLVLGGPMFWPIDRAADVLGTINQLAPAAPDELGILLVVGLAPPMPVLPPERYGTPVVGVVVCWSGDIVAGEKAIEPLRAIGCPLADAVRPVPYRTIQSLLDSSAPAGVHSYWRSHQLPELTPTVIDILVDGVQTLTSPMSLISGWAIGGAASRVGPDKTAVGPRPVGFELRAIANWRPGEPSGEPHREWSQHIWDTLRPFSSGQYATFLADEGPEGVRAVYGQRLPRLVALKDRCDPANVFHSNVNITPSQGESQC